MDNQTYRIQSGTWSDLEKDAKWVRKAVFVIEQNIPESEEWDAQDSISLHFVVYAQDQPIATARLLQNNSIGRVAVLQQARGTGLGKRLMQHIIQVAKDQQREYVKLSAQTHAIGFYANLGFSQHGDEYLDCGIPHVDMTMNLKQD